MTKDEAMKMALDALIPAVDGKAYTSWAGYGWAAIEALRTALAQPEPEPVAWMLTELDGTPLIDCDDLVVKPRPVLVSDKTDCIPLYTAPPAKEWAGLTDDEYELMAEKRVTNYFFNTLDYAHDIEAKLKEKNT